MPIGPEQKGGEAEKPPKPTFEEEIRSLIEPQKEGKPPFIQDVVLQGIATQALEKRSQTPERLSGLLVHGDRWCLAVREQIALGKERIEKVIEVEREWKLLSSVLAERTSEEAINKVQVKVSEGKVDSLAQAILKLEQRVAAGIDVDRQILESQKRQLEYWAGGGYEGVVSAEDAQVALSFEMFETQQPAWYRELNPQWQEVLRQRMFLMSGCYVKRSRGHLDLAAMIENPNMRIERDTLDFMWHEMPGFRIALVTMIDDLFEMRIEAPPGLKNIPQNQVYLMVLKQEVREGDGILSRFAEYKRELIRELESYFDQNPHLIRLKEGQPRFSSKTAARAAVSAAWNLIFVANAVDSGDQGDLKEEMLTKLRRVAMPTEEDIKSNPTIGRKVRNPITYAEQVRAMMLPADKAWGKSVRGEMEVGTEETWLGDLGDYIAERNRHDKTFRAEFFRRERRLVPQRLFASFFDMTNFEIRRKEGRREERSIARKLIEADKVNLKGQLRDVKKPENVDFKRELVYSELWGGYLDRMDSARKVYEMIGGKNRLERDEEIQSWRQTLATALSKLRSSNLAPYFNHPDILVSCIAGSRGLIDFTSEYLLNILEEKYDSVATFILDDDRLFANMPDGSRAYVLKKLNSKDLHSWGGFLGAVFPIDRFAIRRQARAEAKRLRAQ